MLTPISEADLIVNEHGRIYHLHLKPDELASTVITVGDRARVPIVSQYFDEIEVKVQHREFVTHTGILNKQRLSVMSTGMGTDNIDIFMTELDALVNIDLDQRILKDERRSLNIVRFGTSGAMQADIPMDSILVSRFGLGLDGMPHFYNCDTLPATFSDLDLPYPPYLSSADPDLFSRLHTAETVAGITITSPGFYGSQQRNLRLPLRYPNLIEQLSKVTYEGYRATNFDMETAGIFALSHTLGHRACAINAIIANRIHNEFSRQAEKTIQRVIEHGLERLVSS